MKQLGELLGLQEEFEKRGIAVAAVAKELETPEELTKTLQRFPDRWFDVAGAPEGEGLESYQRTSGYLIDAEGLVRAVFPMETYNRPSWWAVLGGIDAALGAE